MNLQLIDALPWRDDHTRIVKLQYLYHGVPYQAKVKEVNDGKTTKRVCPCCGAHVGPLDLRATDRGLQCGWCARTSR